MHTNMNFKWNSQFCITTNTLRNTELNDRALVEPFQFILYNLTLELLWGNWLDLNRTSNVTAVTSQCLFEVKDTDEGFCCDQDFSFSQAICLSACSDCKDPKWFAHMHFSQCNNLVSGKNWGTGSQASPQAGLWCPVIIRDCSRLGIWRKEGQWGLHSVLRDPSWNHKYKWILEYKWF